MKTINTLVFLFISVCLSYSISAAPINFNGDIRISSVNQSGNVVISSDGMSFSIYDTGSEYLYINFLSPVNSTGISYEYSYTPATYTTDANFLAETTASGTFIDSDIHYGFDGNISGTQTLLFQGDNIWHNMLWATERGYGSPTQPDNLILTISNVNFEPVPLPSAVYLFASGILGLLGIARKRKYH